MIPGSGRSPGEGHGYPLQYSCLKNSMDRGAWQTRVHRVAKSWTQLRLILNTLGFPGGAGGKEPASQCRPCRRYKRHSFDPWNRKVLWSRKRQPAPVFLPGEFHRQRSLAGYSPWGSQTYLSMHTSLHLIYIYIKERIKVSSIGG